MIDPIRTAISRLLDRSDLTAELMHAAMSAIMEGEADPAEIAALLTALRMKGEVVDELVGAARAMHEHSTKIPISSAGLLDTCGTGGDELHTFNISTAAALVAAAAGVKVAKHGNRSVSSSSGSADVLEALGVDIESTPDEVAGHIAQVGIGFCFAPLLHGAMKHAAPVRRQLGFRTIFNLLGPLTNPASAEYQLVGANRRATAGKLAEALAQLGRRKALVVCGADELDEVSLWGETAVFVVERENVIEESWTNESLGLPSCAVGDLRVDSAAESADMILGVLDGKAGAARDIVLANAAAALVAAERADNSQDGVAIAAEAIDSGRAAELCRELAAASNR